MHRCKRRVCKRKTLFRQPNTFIELYRCHILFQFLYPSRNSNIPSFQYLSAVPFGEKLFNVIFYVDQIPSKLERTFPPIPYSVNLNAKLQPSFSPIVLSCILRPRGSRIVVKGFTGGQISGESRIVGGGRSRQAIDRVCSRVAGRSGAGVGVAMVGKVHSVCTSRPYMQLAGKRIAGGDAVV